MCSMQYNLLFYIHCTVDQVRGRFPHLQYAPLSSPRELVVFHIYYHPT